jgi:hypothetical protein
MHSNIKDFSQLPAPSLDSPESPVPTKPKLSPVPTKSKLADELRDIIFKKTVSNSYYNDEHYVPCKTANLDKAYALLLKTNSITKEDIEATTEVEDEETEKTVTMTGLDMLRLTFIGDFDQQLSKSSSLTKNLEAAKTAWEAMAKSMDKNELQEIWESKHITPKEERSKLDGEEYRVAYIREKSLAEIIRKRIEFEGLKDENELEAGYTLCVNLRGYKEFVPPEGSYLADAIKDMIDRAPEKEAKLAIKKRVADAARAVRKKDFKTLAAISDYYVRGAAIRALVFGVSNDSYFNSIVKQPSIIKNLISERVKGQDIDI